MDTVREIAASVSVAAVVIGSVYIICPSGVMSRQMKYIAGLIMLLCLVSPFLSAGFSLPEIESRADYSVSAGDMLARQTEYIAASVLKAEGIEFEKIEVFMDISESGDISIYRIHLHGVSDNKARELLSESLGGCEVVIEND